MARTRLSRGNAAAAISWYQGIVNEDVAVKLLESLIVPISTLSRQSVLNMDRVLETVSASIPIVKELQFLRLYADAAKAFLVRLLVLLTCLDVFGSNWLSFRACAGQGLQDSGSQLAACNLIRDSPEAILASRSARLLHRPSAFVSVTSASTHLLKTYLSPVVPRCRGTKSCLQHVRNVGADALP
jgi:hypothetical protein